MKEFAGEFDDELNEEQMQLLKDMAEETGIRFGSGLPVSGSGSDCGIVDRGFRTRFGTGFEICDSRGPQCFQGLQ